MKLTGVMPPITTPFQDGKLASDKLKKNFQEWNKTGPHIKDHACWDRDGINSGDYSIHQ
jgi:hypothetical protein